MNPRDERFSHFRSAAARVRKYKVELSCCSREDPVCLLKYSLFFYPSLAPTTFSRQVSSSVAHLFLLMFSYPEDFSASLVFFLPDLHASGPVIVQPELICFRAHTI
jgi:hypothetical protein